MTYPIFYYFVNLTSYRKFKMCWPFCRLSNAAARLLAYLISHLHPLSAHTYTIMHAIKNNLLQVYSHICQWTENEKRFFVERTCLNMTRLALMPSGSATSVLRFTPLSHGTDTDSPFCSFSQVLMNRPL